MKATILVFLLCSSYFSYAGGGWTQEKNKGYFKISEYWIKANQHYISSGEIEPNATIGFYSTALYGEYGITDKWTALLNFPFFARNTINNQISILSGQDTIFEQGDALNGIGDIDLGIKYSLFKNDHIAIAASLFLGIPSGRTSNENGSPLQLGDTEFNQYLKVDFSAPFSIKKVNLYATTYVGLNHRTKGFSEEFRWGVELGAGLFKQHLWLTGRIEGITSFKNGTPSGLGATNSTSVFANDTEYISIGFEGAAVLYKNFGVSFAYTSAFFAKNIFAAPSYSVGVFYELK